VIGELTKVHLGLIADDSIALINARIFRFVYKHEKHKGREKIKKFLKDIIKDSGEESGIKTDDSDTEVLADSDDEKAKPIDVRWRRIC